MRKTILNTSLKATFALGALVIGFQAIDESAARDNKKWGNIKCECMCDAGEGVAAQLMSYNAVAHCFRYNNKTCNFEGRDGLMKTGTLVGCSPNKTSDAANHGEMTTEQGPTPERPSIRPDAPKSTKREGR